MNLLTIEHHTVDLGLLPEAPLVLDVGCRMFDFTRGVKAVRPKATIYAMDPDPEMPRPEMSGVAHLQEALIYGDDKTTEYVSWHDGIGNFVPHGAPRIFFQLATANQGKFIKVPCTCITHLMHRLGVKHWDLVKLDCEASEFAILENWPGPIATQISVEFHDYHDRQRWNDAYFECLLGKLRTKGYRPVQHELIASGVNDMGHWDSLFEQI